MSNLLNLLDVRALILSDDDNLNKLSDDLSSFYSLHNLEEVKLPMMLARRLSQGDKLALNLANTFLTNEIEALVFSSRHGELARSVNILDAIAKQEDVSPTDFSMSVHNACVSQFLIINKLRLPYSSISGSEHCFIQGLYESLNLLLFGYKKVLYIDFDSKLPSFYEERLSKEIESLSYATAFLFEKGNSLNIEQVKMDISKVDGNLPESLKFLSLYKQS